MRQSENVFIFCNELPKRDFLTENKKVNAPLAMGVTYHGEGSILSIFTAQIARVSLAVTEVENELDVHPS